MFDPTGYGSVLESAPLFAVWLPQQALFYLNIRAAEASASLLYTESRATYLQDLFWYSDIRSYMYGGGADRGRRLRFLSWENRTVAVDYLAYLGDDADVPVERLDPETAMNQAAEYVLGKRKRQVAVNRGPGGRSQWTGDIIDAIWLGVEERVPGPPGQENHAEIILKDARPAGYRGLSLAAGHLICRSCYPEVRDFFDVLGPHL